MDTVNDKSFEVEKFRGLLGSSGMRGKVLRFFPSPPSYIHGFSISTKTATSVSTKTSRSSGEFSLKLSLAYLEMDESTLLTHVCADFTLFRMIMQSQEEKSYSGSESKVKQIRALTASLLASSTSYFLISWQEPSRFSPLLWNTWCQLSGEQNFSRENFRSLLKICKNRESFLTVKLLSFTVV